jgi:tRNA pseudouridine38-40 synthase
MRNIRLTIEYDGTDYSGWQVQNKPRTKTRVSHSKTIQGTIESALKRILQEDIKLIASGRTDAGVHALAQVANFRTNSDIPVVKLRSALNGILPDDIVVKDIKEVGPNFHSRFSAKSKTYQYIILNSPYRSVLLRGKSYFFRFPLNTRLMRKEARCLLGRHNFQAFCGSASVVKSAIRSIKRLGIKKLPGYRLISIEIEADGFLYNMARNIVGTLIEIGRGKIPAGYLRKILASRNRKLAGPTAPARGLFLVKVKY